MPVTTLVERRPVAVGSAQDILERLERYAAAHRVRRVPTTGPPLPARHFDPATVDLFPYDLLAAVVGCAATILAGVVLARPAALVFAFSLIASGAWARQHRWFPAVGVNLVIGALIGLLLVVVS